MGRGWDRGVAGRGRGRSFSGAGKRPAYEKSVPIFRGSGAVSKRETNLLAGIEETPEQPLPKRPD